MSSYSDMLFDSRVLNVDLTPHLSILGFRVFSLMISNTVPSFEVEIVILFHQYPFYE